jgi:alpha-L-fucosidase
MIRSIQPGIIIVRLPGFEDLATPEQHIPQNGVRDIDGRLLPWEGCQVISAGTWGYSRDNKIWKNVRTVAEMLVRHVSRGGNLLLNLAPTSRGCFDKQSTKVLDDLAEWMKFHKRAIHDCTVAPEEFPEPEGCRYTYNPAEKRLYLHFLAWPDQRIFLDGMAQRIEYAQFLHDGSEVHMTEYDPINTHTARIPRGAEMLSLPVERPDTAVPVIELFLK